MALILVALLVAYKDASSSTGGGDGGWAIGGAAMSADKRHTESQRVRAAASLQERLSRPVPTVWLSGQDAAAYVGVSWPTLRQTIVEHSIPHVRFGTRWQIEVAVLDDHLRRLAEAQAASG